MYTPSTKKPASSNVITILLKTLIFGHLEVLDYHPGVASAGLWRHALPYVFGDLWYRPRQRILGDDVDLQILGADHHPRDFLAALVGRGLDVTPAPHRVNPFGREGRLGRGPCELYSVCQNEPSSALYWTRCCSWASCSRRSCSSCRWRSCSASCCGKKIFDTVMFTSVTRRPTRLSTLLATLRLTASASWGIDLPYSAVSVRSMAASSWPTSTETPWVWLLLPPPVMLPRMPLTAWEPPLPILMPSTSWDAMPAIFDTTLSEMLVAPRSVCSGLELSSLIFLLSSVLRYAARRVIRRYIASRIIAPRVATRMDLRLICVS